MNSFRCFSGSQGNPPASGIRRGIRRQTLLFHSFLVPPFFSLRLRRLFLSSRLCGQSPHGHFWQQKRNGPRRFPFHTACGDPQICSCPRQPRTSAETKKVPKDCHVLAWYPLTLLTILNSVCPGSPQKEPEPAGCLGGCGHIGYVLPVPVPRIQVSHKNQLRVYINTISCIMST